MLRLNSVKKICYVSTLVLTLIFLIYVPKSNFSYSTSELNRDRLTGHLSERHSQTYETPSDRCYTNRLLGDNTKQGFQKMSDKLKELRQQILVYPEKYFHGQGIVLTVGLEQLRHAKANLKLIEISGTQLPVQVWYSKDQISLSRMMDLIRFVPNINASVCCFIAEECRSLTKVWKLNSSYIYKPSHHSVPAKAFPYKPTAILSATFAEVLFLDCDAFVTRDPQQLFLSDPKYLKFGALFFPDAMKSRQHPAMWKFLNLSCAQDEYEFESSMILVDKRKVWNGLYMTKLMNDHHNSFYKYTDGDKDTFRIGFRFMRVQYYLVTTPCSTGLFENNHFCGYTLCRTDSLTRHIYVNHVHLLKYNQVPYTRKYLAYTRIGLNVQNRSKPYSFQYCKYSGEQTYCFHIVKEEMIEEKCNTGIMPDEQLDQHIYQINESLPTEKLKEHRVILTETDNLLGQFVNNVIKYMK